MPVVACPNCRTQLDLDPDDIGHRLECPGCLAHFVADRPADPPPAPPPTEAPPPLPDLAPPESERISELPPPAPPRPTLAKPKVSTLPPPAERPSRRSDSPVVLKCPACRGEVSVTADDLGHKVECPMCQQVFRAEDPDRGGGRRSSRRDDDDEPRWRRRDSRRSRYDDDDEYDRPRRRRGYRDEDPYESSDPKAWVWQAKRDLATPGGGLMVLGWLDVVYGGLYILVGVLIGLGVSSGGGGAAGGPTWGMVAITIGLGVTGILLGGVKAFGGMEMRKVKNRRLSLLACFASFPPIYLLMCLLGFFDNQYFIACCPAIFTIPSFVVGLVFGILGMGKLFNKSLSKAFEVNRPDGDVDAV